jgi:hypothetical protein
MLDVVPSYPSSIFITAYDKVILKKLIYYLM